MPEREPFSRSPRLCVMKMPIMLGRQRPRTRLELVTGAVSAPVPVEAMPSFDEAYGRHSGYVAGLAGRILGRNDEVADVVQDVFLIAHRRLHEVRNPTAVRAWLGRITVREASRRLRWRRLRAFLPAGRVLPADLIADDGAGAELRPLLALLYATLDRVPARARATLVLRHLLDEPLAVVAQLCGCSIATAKRRIADAETVLRPILEDRPPEAE